MYNEVNRANIDLSWCKLLTDIGASTSSTLQNILEGKMLNNSC